MVYFDRLKKLYMKVINGLLLFFILFLPFSSASAASRIISTPAPTAANQRMMIIHTPIPTPTPTSVVRRMMELSAPSVTPTPVLSQERRTINASPTPTNIPEERLKKTASDTGILKTLETDNGRPLYRTDSTENFKLFNIFPLSAKIVTWTDPNDHTITRTKRNWLASLLSGWNFTGLLSKGPDFEFKNVRFEPLSFTSGSQVVVHADLVNTGSAKAYSGVGNHVSNWMYNKDQQVYGTNEEVIDLAPGEVKHVAYVWDHVVCGAPVSLIFDTNRVLKEISSNTVWYGTATCAPGHGPDLAVTQLKFEGTSYGGKMPGAPNKVSYTIKNIGDSSSDPIFAFAVALPSQFISIIQVPLLQPGAIYSGSFTYTPTNCDRLQIILDPQETLKTTETNRDNNVEFESKQVTDWCNALPNLKFDRVYWKTNGYSFGDSSLPNGSVMNFEIDVGNLSMDPSVGCATLVKIRVDVNGTKYTDIPVGTVGNCTNGGWHNTVDNAHMAKTVKFNVGPACNANLTFTLNSDNFNPEFDHSDNVWNTTVKCN